MSFKPMKTGLKVLLGAKEYEQMFWCQNYDFFAIHEMRALLYEGRGKELQWTEAANQEFQNIVNMGAWMDATPPHSGGYYSDIGDPNIFIGVAEKYVGVPGMHEGVAEMCVGAMEMWKGIPGENVGVREMCVGAAEKCASESIRVDDPADYECPAGTKCHPIVVCITNLAFIDAYTDQNWDEHST